MTQAATIYPFHLRAGAIKRVIRRGRKFFCGLCRTFYGQEDQAVGCLTECWGELLRLDPVLPRRHGMSMVYRCRFCARDFVKRQAARGCAAECRGRAEERHEADMGLLASDDVTPAARPFKRRVAAPSLMVAAPLRRKLVRTAPVAGPTMEPVAQSPAPAAAEPSPGPAAPAAAPGALDSTVPVAGAAAAGPAPAKKVKGDQAFMRDGAEYVCTACSKRYFTKLEVTSCFESH